MPRELSKELFGGPQINTSAEERPLGSQRITPQVTVDQFRELVHEVQRLKRHNKELESNLEATERRLKDYVAKTNKGFERMQAMSQRIEKSAKASLQELASRLSTLSGRLTERRMSEDRIQQLVDRHNQVVQKFELKLSQLQKLTSEQEMKLMSYKSSLQDLQRRR